MSGDGMSRDRRSIAQACAHVLAQAQPRAKLMAARQAARAWRLGQLDHRFDRPMPHAPGRPDEPALLPPNRMPRRGKAGSQRGRIALLHALAHIEFAAIDLAFDMAGRFGQQFPRAFVDDWMKVGADEAMHFALLDRRLRQLGSYYGALPAHDGLWDAAEETAHSAMARLAVVPMVLEARGLDVTPQMVERFRSAGDLASAKIMQRIYQDEIAHVGFGSKWFAWGFDHDRNSDERTSGETAESPANFWVSLINRHFRGTLKPPFNDSARHEAGLTLDFYGAVASGNQTGL